MNGNAGRRIRLKITIYFNDFFGSVFSKVLYVTNIKIAKYIALEPLKRIGIKEKIEILYFFIEILIKKIKKLKIAE